MPHTVIRKAALGVVILSLTACASGPAGRVDYKKSVTMPPLEVPPDLTLPSNSGAITLPVLPGAEADGPMLRVPSGVRIGRDGAARWLVLDVAPEALWPKLRDFWKQLGLELVMDDPRIGVMQTQWAENRADVPGGFLKNLISAVVPNAYSAPTRDRFRVRLERTPEGQSELFLTHYGVEEVIVTETEFHKETGWRNRHPDPELANEILNRLLVYLGAGEQQARELLASEGQPAPARARLAGTTLVVDEPFARAWRRVGIALDRIGLVVMDRDRSAGTYFVEESEELAASQSSGEGGLFSGLFSSGGERARAQHRLTLNARGEQTDIVILSGEGQQGSSASAREILERLLNELR